jgi:hypothetical protein
MIIVAVESYVNNISFSDNVNFCVDICGGCKYFGTHPCGPFPFNKLFIILSPLCIHLIELLFSVYNIKKSIFCIKCDVNEYPRKIILA